MSFLNRLSGLFKRRKLPKTAIYVETQEQADAINGLFHMTSESFMKNVKITDPSYGRILTLEFDLSNPEGEKAFNCIKVASEFNGNGYMDIRTGDNYATLEFSSFEDAEEVRKPFVLYQELQKEIAEKKQKEAALSENP